MKIYGDKEIWFVTGSQHLYGPQVLEQVAANSQEIADGLTGSDKLSAKIVAQPTVKSPEEILAVCQRANNDSNCVGLILWMHTFSPAKMWIAGLKALNKPYMHLHTQFNAELPWAEINMDYMNLHQSAHGDREFGYISTRLQVHVIHVDFGPGQLGVELGVQMHVGLVQCLKARNPHF